MANPSENMDYAAHEHTYALFMTMLKFSIVALVFVVVALYSFIIAHNVWAGLFFIVLAVPAGFGATRLGKPGH